jgi:hypothetical protein
MALKLVEFRLSDVTDEFVELRALARRWRRQCGRAGGACCQQEEMSSRADAARRKCADELEEVVRKMSRGQESKADKESRRADRADDLRREEARRRAADEVAGVEPGHPEICSPPPGFKRL